MLATPAATINFPIFRPFVSLQSDCGRSYIFAKDYQ